MRLTSLAIGLAVVAVAAATDGKAAGRDAPASSSLVDARVLNTDAAAVLASATAAMAFGLPFAPVGSEVAGKDAGAHVQRVESLHQAVQSVHSDSKSLREQAEEEERQMEKLQERIRRLTSSATSLSSLVPPSSQKRRQPYEAAIEAAHGDAKGGVKGGVKGGATSFLQLQESYSSFLEQESSSSPRASSRSSFHAERARHLKRHAKETSARRHSAKLHRARLAAEAQLDARHRLLLMTKGHGAAFKGAAVLSGHTASAEEQLDLMVAAHVDDSLATSRAKVASLAKRSRDCEQAEEKARKHLLKAAGAHSAANLLASELELRKGPSYAKLALASNMPYQTAARTARTLDNQAGAAVEAKAEACATSPAHVA